VQRFGADALPDKIVSDAEERPDTKHEFLHAVFPNPERVSGALNHRGIAFASYYIAVHGRRIVSEGGYRTFPYAVGRYTTGPKEVYGRSPAMTVLPEIKMVNEMSKTVLRAGEKALDPPLLLQEDGALSGFELRPGALNFGGVNDQGNAVVRPLDLGSLVDIGADMIERRRPRSHGKMKTLHTAAHRWRGPGSPQLAGSCRPFEHEVRFPHAGLNPARYDHLAAVRKSGGRTIDDGVKVL